MKPAFKPLYVLCLSLAALGFVITASGFQLIKTTLNLTVRDELGNTVQGANVKLFETEEDYTAEKNVAAEGVTDAKGILKLKDLKAIPYFVMVKKDDKDNVGGGEQTGKLEAKKINKVTIVIQ
ncbi:carboxypeptidase regulatory-like domain-containing protein [Fulvivirgaceae bacterium PWU4]|uniref:Carboxypeptidase regulatory-like domain-containing protein n=1 Tax=Chryseosolibacter histidini TaxID=2782349 RepID=A0AAP2DNR3_9BACT|nr:carboxypeptidase regulatory-like domain-containing protein [Chryseosolibacter histidini]MBT1699671.1 carboxypeptidase regulatory-like domain-containing protein [Chryseosolibacter histidini]